MKKQQFFALFLATCLLSSDMPKVHASQEEPANQENSSIQEASTQPDDSATPETPTQPEDSTQPDDSAAPETPTQPEDSTQPDDSAAPETPTQPEDSTQPDDSATPETPTQPEDSTQPDDSATPETPTQPEDSTQPDDSATPETPTQPEDSTQPDDSATPETPTQPEDSTQPDDSATPETPTQPEDSTQSDDSTAPVTPAQPNDSVITVTPIEQPVQENSTKQEKTVAEFSIELLADDTPPTEQEAYNRMIALKSNPRYQEGAPWTNETHEYKLSVPIDGKNMIGAGCVAFVFELSDVAFGTALPARKLNKGSFSFSDVKVGDILRVDNNAHSVIVLRKTATDVVIAEGNAHINGSGGIVNWGRGLSMEDVMNADYMITRYPKNYVSPDDPTANDPVEGGEGTLDGGFTWKVTNSGKLVISGTGAMPDFATADDQPWKDFNDNIITIEIVNGVTKIGNYAFSNTGAVSVTIPNTIETIGDNAFKGASLASLNIPSSVKTIGNSAFHECGNLVSATISDGVETIGQSAFRSCNQLKSITLPASITSVGGSAFQQCQELTSAKFASGDTQVQMDDYIFAQCYRLTSVTLPSEIDRIGVGMFQNCGGLTSIKIPQGATEIGESAFATCTSLAEVRIPNSIKEIGRTAFVPCASLKQIHFSGTEAEWNSILKMLPILATGTTVLYEQSYPYTVTVNGGSSDKNEYEAGEQVTIIATVPEGEAFEKWTSDNPGVKFADETSAQTTFTMPAADVEVIANYKDAAKPDPSKDYTVNVTNGTGSGNYNAGDNVSITAEPAPAGKEFDKWTSEPKVTFTNETSATTSFDMPAANVTVTATYKDVVTPPTPDKPDNPEKPDTPSTNVPTTPQKAQKVTISQASAELGIQETLNLQAWVIPNTVSQDIVWSIDDKNLAELTVDATKPTFAKITTKAHGSVIVTAKSKSHPELSATCTIKIKGNAANLALLNDTIAKISDLNYNVNGKTVKTETEAQNWIKEKIDALQLKEITIDSIDITSFTPAEPEEQGNFTFTVTLSTGEGKEKVTLTSHSLQGILSQTTTSSSSSGGGGRGSSSSSTNKENNTNNENSETTNNQTTNNQQSNPEESNGKENNENENSATNNTSSKNMDKFVDVSHHWAADSIQFVVEKGYFAGTSENSFSPDVPMTRAMVVSVLGRIANAQGNTTTKFADIDQNQYYAPFIGWALENKIASGVSETEFNPNANITREQLAVMFLNFIKSQGYAFDAEKDVSFTDYENISPWAAESVDIMVKAGILNGRTDGSFDPKGVATRAEVATLLKLFLEKANK